MEPNTENWDEMEGWKEAACPPGTLVLIHGASLTLNIHPALRANVMCAGSVMHKSPPNPSDKSRLIYTFHMIEGGNGVKYDERNWLQPTKEMPFPALF